MSSTLLGLGIFFAACSLMADPVASRPSAKPAAGPEAGTDPISTIVGLRAVDVTGVVHRLGLRDGLRPVALVFLEPSCPVASRYAPELNAIFKRATSANVEFYGVLSDPNLTPRAARAFRAESRLSYPILFDASGELAARLDPTHVPEAFVVSRDDRVVYRGRIDDRFAAVGKLRPRVTQHDLRDAIDTVSRGAAPRRAKTTPVGCIFEAWPGGFPETVTYTRNIAPLLNANCNECHTDGGIGPFALDTYKLARRKARMIALVCEKKLMPPWRAEPGFGHFRDERILSHRQVKLLRQWVEDGAERGRDSDLLPVKPRKTTKWRLGKPDIVLTMAEPFSIPAAGDDIYRYFVLPRKLPRDIVITAMDFVPGDPTVVHHMNSFVDYSGRARKKDAEDTEPGFSVFGKGSFFDYNSGGEDGSAALGGWAPGVEPYELPPDHGIYLQRGGEIVIEVHYHLSGKPTKDQSSLGLYLAKKPVSKYLDGSVIGTVDLSIPAGDDDYVRHAWMEVPADLRLIDVMPHMHSIGKSMKSVITLPDGSTQPLISIPDWDLRWQNIYTLREPLFIPKGSRIDAWFHFDNSADNVDNPNDPPKLVKWGWATDEEMAELWMGFVPARRADSAAIHKAAEATWYRSGRPTRREP